MERSLAYILAVDMTKEKRKEEKMAKKLRGMALQRRLRRSRRAAPMIKNASHSSVKKTVRTAGALRCVSVSCE